MSCERFTEQPLKNSAVRKRQGAQSVQDVVEKLGFGPYQVVSNIAANGVWISDGAMGLVVSAVTYALREAWNLTPTQCGSLTALVYLGTLLGNLVSGWLADRHGRRTPIMLSYMGIASFSMVSALSPNFFVLASLLFCVGLSFGMGQPASATMMVEISPAKWRTLNQGALQFFFILGELYCCLMLWMQDPTLLSLDWQQLLVFGAAPAVVLSLFASYALGESPAYLVATNNPKAARSVLSTIRRVNCKGPVSIDFEPTRHRIEAKGDLRLVFGRKRIYDTLVLCFATITYNFIAYGLIYAFPHVLAQMNVGASATGTLALGVACELPGFLIGVLIGTYTPRKVAMSVYFFGTAISCLTFAWAFTGYTHGQTRSQGLPLFLGYYGMKMFPQIGILVLYVYTCEMYPVTARATGTSVVMASGRVGAILTSLVYEWLRADGPYSMPPGTFFYACGSLTIISMVLFTWLPETREWGGGLCSCRANEEALGEDAENALLVDAMAVAETEAWHSPGFDTPGFPALVAGTGETP